VGLREDYRDFDFAIPFILREAEQWLEHQTLDINALPPFFGADFSATERLAGQRRCVYLAGFTKQLPCLAITALTVAVMNIGGYNDFLSRMTRRISQALSQPLPKGNKIATHLANPYLQVNTAQLTGWLDGYIRERLFSGAFVPLHDENWRVLLLQPVLDHISKVIALALIEAEDQPLAGDSEVHYRHLSEVGKLPMRKSSSLEVNKCIYERLAYPARNGGLEKALIEWANADSHVQAFCKISETRHDFVRLRYVKEDGLPAFYSPDFLLRTNKAVYLVETKAQGQVSSPNVQRKLKAVAAWCGRINALPAASRSDLPWHTVLLGESVFWEWRNKGERLAALCEYAKIRDKTQVDAQQSLQWN